MVATGQRIRATSVTAAEATKIMTDKAQELGADAADSKGIVRALMLANGFGFDAWFCVICELADRDAQSQGFRDQFDRAAQNMRQRASL